MSRTIEMLLGISGGTMGVLVSLFTASIGGVLGILFVPGSVFLVIFGVVTILFGVIGIIGGAIVSKNNKAASALMLLSGIGGFITAHVFWVVPGVLLIGGGALALRSS